MPTVTIHLLEGYDAETRQRLGRAVTDAVRSIIPAPPDAVTVMISEVAADNYMRGGSARSGAAALPDPADTVRAFLSAMERRDLNAARGFLGDGFEMMFPGDVRMTSLEELVDWAAPRYRFVTKRYDGFDSLPAPDAGAVVYCHGTLSGEWPDGTPFADIRFIDRFELRGGRLTRQQVWNDIAESRP